MRIAGLHVYARDLSRSLWCKIELVARSDLSARRHCGLDRLVRSTSKRVLSRHRACFVRGIYLISSKEHHNEHYAGDHLMCHGVRPNVSAETGNARK